MIKIKFNIINIIKFIFLLLLLINIIKSDVDKPFTCSNGPKQCPDKGNQLMSSGGNVTVKVIRAKHLKNSNPSMGSVGVANPYVVFSVGDIEVKSKVAFNDNINPIWNDDVNIGLLASGTEIRVKVYETIRILILRQSY